MCGYVETGHCLVPTDIIKMITKSAKETMLVGEELAKRLRPGDLVALYGNLGSGKTTFTKGLGKGLGVKLPERINSPTFVLIKEYNGKIPLYHLDLYRLNSFKEIGNLAIEEYIYGNGVTVIEWAEKMKCMLPEKRVSVRLNMKGCDKREVEIEDLRD